MIILIKIGFKLVNATVNKFCCFKKVKMKKIAEILVFSKNGAEKITSRFPSQSGQKPLSRMLDRGFLIENVRFFIQREVRVKRF